MSEVSRRVALLGGAAAVGSTAIAYVVRDTGSTPGHATGSPLSPTALAKPPAHLVHLLRSHYLPAVGAPVLARQAAHVHRLRLVEILDVERATVAERQFNLLFEPLGTGEVAEGIYEISGARIPHGALFLSAVGMGRGRRLQALVNSPT